MRPFARLHLRWMACSIFALASALSCSERPVQHQQVVQVALRSNCEACHRPEDASGEIHGIEEAHAALSLSCTTCHGGTPFICDGEMTAREDKQLCDGEWVFDKDRAHVTHGRGPKFLRNLSSGELDRVAVDYLQFINPGDFRVLDRTCGTCHADISRRVPYSTMAHTAGEVAVARYRAGMQPDAGGVFGAKSIKDPDSDSGGACAASELTQMTPAPMRADVSDGPHRLSVGNAQDQYLAKSCFRCHLNDFGENRFSGDYRSSGCTACHMPYAEDGRSQSADPRISKNSAPHPITHELTKSPPTGQCTTCHYRGARIGMSYQGIREAGGPGQMPPNAAALGRSLHGHDSAFYLTDENDQNDFDETPPDLHFEAGMDCIDCHTEAEVHGDGHLYADAMCVVTTECTDCHGTVREYANPGAERDNVFERDGRFFLRTKREKKELAITQVKDTVTPGHPKYTELADMAMGVHQGFSHTDDLECYTCHSAWVPTCYGCHVTIDTGRDSRYQATGALVPGHPSGERKWVTLNDLVLLRNSDGLLAPSMPAERFFMTVVDSGNAEPGAPPERLLGPRPRAMTLSDGTAIAGFGQRAVHPHTTRRRSQFMACDRCHSVGSKDTPDNQVLLDITHGFGSKRFPERACDFRTPERECDPERDSMTYWLDATLSREGKPLVAVGQPVPGRSRVLNLQEIDRMRDIVVGEDMPIQTPIPPGAIADPQWPRAQDVSQ